MPCVDCQKTRKDREYWKNQADSAHNRETKLIQEIRTIQSRCNRLQDQVDVLDLRLQAKDQE